MFYEAGYVILIPIAAILFMNLGRHPSIGVCAAFAGISFGYGANIVINGVDNVLVNYTQTATKILDQNYHVSLAGNLIFMIFATLVIAYLGMIITEKYIVPKLGKFNLEDEEDIDLTTEITKKEVKGVGVAVLFTLIVSLLLIYCIIPGLPFSALLLNLKETTYIAQLFGDGSYFRQGSVLIFSGLLGFTGLVYGLRVKTIKNNKKVLKIKLKDFSYLLNLYIIILPATLTFNDSVSFIGI